MEINHLTEAQVAELRGLSVYELAKRNNQYQAGNTGVVYIESKAWLEESCAVIRDELYQRGILSSPEEDRLIDGSEVLPDILPRAKKGS